MMASQFTYFLKDCKRICGKNKSRILFIWLSRSFGGVFLYRLERSLFLVFGKYYSIIRILILPLFNLIQAYSNIDIHYKANIQGGLLILHPSMGITISGNAVVGENLTLTGGNVIGISKKCEVNSFIIGNNCNLGANAVILGPIELGNNIKIGALACVTKSFKENNLILVGSPAQRLIQKTA